MVKALGILLCGVILQLSAVWFMGQNRDGGIFFCCRGVPDSIYHLSMVYQLTRNFPPEEPGMAGVIVTNYHYLANLVIADIIRIFPLPLMETTYQSFSILISVLLGLTVIVIAQLLSLNNKITQWWLFFLYFHGDILYLLIWLRGKGLNFDVTIFDDATKLLAGPPRSLSITLLFTGTALLFLWIQKRLNSLAILTGVTLGSLIGFKVYTGIFALIGMAAVGTYYILKRDWKMTLAPIITLITSLAVYLPVNGTSGRLIFNGFYRFDDFIAQPSFGLQNLVLWKETGIWPLTIIFVFAYFIFLYGTSLIAVLPNKLAFKLIPSPINIFLLSANIITGIIGVFFVQNIGGLNTVQFLIALYFTASIYASLTATRLPLIIGIVIILFTIPRPLHEAWQNIKMIKNHQGIYVSQQELEGLHYLREKTPSNAVIGLPKDFANQQISLYTHFLSQRPIYLAGYTGVLQDHEVVGAKQRLDTPNYAEIDYFFFPKKYSNKLEGPIIFENQEIIITKNPNIDK